MDVEVQLTDLYELHPRLVWDEIIAAAAIVLGEKTSPPFLFDIEVIDLPSFEGDVLHMTILANRLNAEELAKRRRTFEWSRLVELAAIALAGLGLYHTEKQEIGEVAVRSSGGDYLVGAVRHLLEVTGRSRRSDFETAWQLRWQRLTQHAGRSFYLFAAEFQTPRGRLAFQP